MKKLTILITLILLTSTATFAYVISEYRTSTQASEQVTVGDTVITTDGITVQLASKEQGTLTYQAVEESDTNKHTLTYSYNYTTYIDYVDIIVSCNDDIIINTVDIGDTIDITFSLNESKDWSEGDVISVVFTFELVQGVNVNEASYDELVTLGLSEIEIDRTLTQRSLQPFGNLTEWAIRIDVAGFEQRYQDMVDSGMIVFN